jgi:N-methylhydantoinase A/oxoprolinase/acetone carboxylase beta subunit
MCQNILVKTKEIPSSGISDSFSALSPDKSTRIIFDRVIEVHECIDGMGNVCEPLVESEINNALRQILPTKASGIYIFLKNSSINPLHEKILLNLLRTAGCCEVYASHQLHAI